MVWISLVSNDDDSIFWYSNLLRRLSCRLDEWQLCDEGFGAAVLELESELIHGVARIRWAQYPACPMTPPGYRRCIDAVGGVQREHIAFLPIPEGLESLSKVDSGALDLSICVRSIGIWVEVDYYPSRLATFPVNMNMEK